MYFSINIYLPLIISLLPLVLHSSEPGFAKPNMNQYSIELLNAYKSKDKDYKPRTEHLNTDGSPIYINRLILSDSAYLLQHAHNPVNWHGWSKQVFARARAQNKPIFLSVGYSTCHWCHVMERESFENEKIAKYLNDNFVAIKVDREQHPQIDNYYMSALINIRKSGGWPMSAFLLPDGKTFHAETYLPPKDFLALLQEIIKLWQNHESKVREFATNLADTLEKQQETKFAASIIDEHVINNAVNLAVEKTDDLQGGFGSAPKFPHENILLFMLDQYARARNETIGEALWISLDAMAHGGIYDQVGGGFHRYATDNAWLVPHFEKMLYNQAMLAMVYTKASRFSKNPLYKKVARKTLDYVLRDLTDANGGFHAATDADSGEGEGEYFTWSIGQIDQALTPADAKLIKSFYGLTATGNFENTNIMFIETPHAEFAKKHKIAPGDFYKKLDTIHQTLLRKRNKRPLPFKDKKIISSWNGLMINAFCYAYMVFGGDAKYLQAANKAANYIWSKFADNRLPRIINSKNFKAGVLDDYVFMAEGMLSLYDATLDPKWLTRAELLAKTVVAKFKDDKTGDYFMNYYQENEMEIPRIKKIPDGAIYSATGALYRVFTRLFARTGKDKYQDLATELLGAISGIVRAIPTQNSYLLAAVAETITGETGKRQFAGRGHVKILSSKDDKGQYILLEFDDKWHINSNQPLSKNLIPTKVRAEDGELVSVTYPRAQELNLGFSKDTLSLFADKAKIYFMPNPDNPPSKITLTLQACDDKNCLAPETVTLYL